jgi:hypothetical protein
MNRRRASAALAVLLLWSSPALARDPTREDPSAQPPAREHDGDPAPYIAPPPGVYYVTDTYVADTVTSTGSLTTYTTTTIHESTGSYARVLDTVGTGAPSRYDGSAFNGRRSVGDGRAVAGTYYENYVLTESGFVPVSIVFFQDDAELARLIAVDTPRPAVTSSLPATPAGTAPSLLSACCSAKSPPVAAILPSPAPARPVRPGISLFPLSAPLTTVEVLRGRAVALWPRAFVDDREIPVHSWTVIGGEVGETIATTGAGDVPFRTAWRRLASPGIPYEVVFRIEVDTPETGHRIVDAAIAVIVRSPALGH